MHAGNIPQYIHFQNVLVGNGGTFWTQNPDVRACKNAQFAEMRNVAYAAAGIRHVPVRSQKKQRITVIARTIDFERRGIINLEEMTAALKAAFPAVDVEVQRLS
jgi:hypothetical protein